MDMTIEQATKKWVGEFNAISQSLILRAFKDNPEELTELTTITEGDNVYSDELNGAYEVVEVSEDGQTVAVDYDGDKYTLNTDEVYIESQDMYPMWGTMWSFGENIDEEWARDNPRTMSECGFRLYEDEETGDIYFGIDGAGYDFYDKHWIPLYEARGLQWHKTE